MKPDSNLASKIENGDFIITAEYLPGPVTDIKALADNFKNGLTAINVADNPSGVVMSSLSASLALKEAGMEAVYQLITRDRNRIALQSDLLGAAYLGIKNVLCLSGYHQTLGACPPSANVHDIDSIQLIGTVRKMRDEGVLLDGTKIEGPFSMLIGAAANPFLKPEELNMIRLVKKVEAGADFIQTQAVFDVEGFKQWLSAAANVGVTDRCAVLAGVLPLEGAEEAQKLRETYTEYAIPDSILKRLKGAGDPGAQKKEGMAMCIETIKEIKEMKGIRGIHVLSGGKEGIVPEILSGMEI
jgi:methylenetetrahydrofolate reductase (NADPH)